jgi:hypothetical protein
MNRLTVLLSLSLSLSAWMLLGFSGQIAQPQTTKGIEYPYATAEPQKTFGHFRPKKKRTLSTNPSMIAD